MKLTAALILVACLKLSATSLAQRVTIVRNHTSLKEVIKDARKQSGFNFIYTDELLRKTTPFNVEARNVTVAELMEICLKDQPISFKILDQNIVVLQPKIDPASLFELPAQEKPVQGIVKDDQGQALIGVSVRNLSNGKTAITSTKGDFSILAKEGNILEFTFLGYKKERYKVNASNLADGKPFQVQMGIEPTELNAPVVIGYGTTRRKDLTGSVASVNPDEIKNVPFTSIDQALNGKAAGVQVIQADGSPGGVARIRIRGGASLIGTNDPLYIIDGVPVTIQNRYIQNSAEIVNPVESYYGEDFNNSVSGAFSRGLNSLAGLNINDIESIDILKDVSATAIYGSKAANGVVIITTKKGKINMKPTLEANYYAGLSVPLKEKMLNAEQYKAVFKEAAKNLNDERVRIGREPNATATEILNDPNFFGNANTDWLGLVLRNGFNQNADIAVRGGGNGSRYYTSLAYTRQDGVLIGTDFERISGKVNLDNNISDKLQVQTNLDYGFTTNNITNGIYTQAMFAPPTESPYNEDGSYSNLGKISTAYQGFQNPLAVASGINRTKTTSLLGSMALNYDVMKDLRFRSVVSVNYTNYHQLNYVPSYVDIGGFYGRESSGGGLGSQSNSTSLNSFFENTLTYNKTFNERHRLNVVAGTSWEKYKASFFSATGRGYPDDDFLNNLDAAAVPVSVKGSDPSRMNSLLSFYLRANYTWKERYLFTFTGRSDASSKFAPSNQVGYFPSGAFAWRISEEPFMSHVNWVDELKLRVSAGTTGTQNIGDHLWRTLYTPVAYDGQNAVIPSQLGNDAIKWESTLQKDLGLDFTLFQSRLRGTFGYYDKTTDGLLLNISTAPSAAYTNVILNIAKVRNNGFEFDLRGDVIRKKDFQWTLAFNISTNRSKVLNVNGGPFSNPNDRDALNLGTSIVKEGEPLGLLYGRISKGVIKTEKQLEDFKNAFPYWSIFSPYLNIGDLAYEMDETGFWKQDIIGKSIPDFYGGLTSTLNYKNLSLTTLFTFSYGNELMYQNDVASISTDNLANRSTRILDHYNADNPNSNRPRLIYGSINLLTDENVYDASYLKLKSLTLNYAFSHRLLEKVHMKSASIYFSATNLFTITSYPGLDPEVSDDPGSIIGGGRDVSSYPTSRYFVAGIRLGL
ncbi:SusC/RagA family TonB-linked outer membrane protein [Chitinophaga caeni]|uniref:SusC/RagA family TonB-linked outer membrane protein n=1 Tax=Chitinophaga caeni TaxID=2029983 RepID=A0A291R131_9BACT|nr:TonB-dependent receptor [Chitinophaga caeni]ATL49861.1 SusC/RagA family TonB-linked outer membrane protein [Chitinophaga caeni]